MQVIAENMEMIKFPGREQRKTGAPFVRGQEEGTVAETRRNERREKERTRDQMETRKEGRKPPPGPLELTWHCPDPHHWSRSWDSWSCRALPLPLSSCCNLWLRSSAACLARSACCNLEAMQAHTDSIFVRKGSPLVTKSFQLELQLPLPPSLRCFLFLSFLLR